MTVYVDHDNADRRVVRVGYGSARFGGLNLRTYCPIHRTRLTPAPGVLFHCRRQRRDGERGLESFWIGRSDGTFRCGVPVRHPGWDHDTPCSYNPTHCPDDEQLVRYEWERRWALEHPGDYPMPEQYERWLRRRRGLPEPTVEEWLADSEARRERLERRLEESA